MAAHVQAPAVAAKGEVFLVKTLIDHPMETGLRHDDAGSLIPRKIVTRFTCLYNDRVVFSVDLHESIAANPYLAFYVTAVESGTLRFMWEEDLGGVFAIEKPLTVS